MSSSDSDDSYKGSSSDDLPDEEPEAFDELTDLYIEMKGLLKHAKLGQKITSQTLADFINSSTEGKRRLYVALNSKNRFQHYWVGETE